MSGSSADALARLLRIQHYYDNCHEQAQGIAAGARSMGALPEPALRDQVLDLVGQAGDLLVQLDPAQAPFAPLAPHQSTRFESDYESLKAALLAAGAAGRLGIEPMDALLRSMSAMRRTVEQAAKAARLMATLSPG